MLSVLRNISTTCRLRSNTDNAPALGSVRCHASARDGPAKPIVVVGSVNADLVVKIDRLPKAGETIAGSSLEFFPGGKGANQAAAAAKLGYPTYFIGQVLFRKSDGRRPDSLHIALVTTHTLKLYKHCAGLQI
jgi:hypothetical protein